MIDPAIAKNSFVVPALTRLGLYSLDAEKLLMGTAAIESGFRYFRQLGGGPALGMFQMEPAIFSWLYDEFLGTRRHAALKAKVSALSTNASPNAATMVSNHFFAAGMARIRYYAVHSSIPAGLNPQANYWWVNYNGRSPHGRKPSDYVQAWNKLCAKLYANPHPPAAGQNDPGAFRSGLALPETVWV